MADDRVRTRAPLMVGLLAVLLIGGAYMVGRERGRAEHPPGSAPADATIPAGPTGVRPAIAIAPRVPSAATMAQAHADAAMERRHLQDELDASRVRIAGRYAREPVDPAWADARAQRLGGFADQPQMRAMNASVHDLRIDCRSTLCRMTGDFPTRTAAEDWITLYATAVGAEMAHATYAFQPRPDGSVQLELYAEGR